MPHSIDGPGPHVFSVRLWPHDTGRGSMEWRGRVQDLTSGDFRHFRDWETLLDFMRSSLGPQQPMSDEHEQPERGSR